MPKYERTSRIVREDGLLFGEMRRITNYGAPEGSPHNDDSAIKAGYKGAVISNFIHDEHFPALALEAFGPAWFERGFFSLFYRRPAYDQDPLRAVMRDPGGRTDNVQVEAWSETPDGVHIVEGTIGIGDPGEPTALRQRFDNSPPPSELRILRDLVPGQPLGEAVRRMPLMPPRGGPGDRDNEGQMQRREVTVEPIEWYFGPSPWGGPIAGPLGLFRLLSLPRRTAQAERPDAAEVGVTGMAGGTEVRFINGPVFLDKDYIVSGRVLGATESTRAENSWTELTMRDPETGKVVLEAITMGSSLKQSSPLYAQA